MIVSLRVSFPQHIIGAFSIQLRQFVPEEVFPGQVAMVLLVQTREPSIQTLNLINCHASSRVELKLERWVLNVRFSKNQCFEVLFITCKCFGW